MKLKSIFIVTIIRQKMRSSGAFFTIRLIDAGTPMTAKKM